MCRACVIWVCTLPTQPPCCQLIVLIITHLCAGSVETRAYHLLYDSLQPSELLDSGQGWAHAASGDMSGHESSYLYKVGGVCVKSHLFFVII